MPRIHFSTTWLVHEERMGGRTSAPLLEATGRVSHVMSEDQHPLTTNRDEFGSAWRDLKRLCTRIHFLWFVKKDKAAAQRYGRRLECVLMRLPDNDLAILREEGLALLYQLKGQADLAIRHRQREIELIERLDESVHQSVKDGRYGESMATAILARRDVTILQESRAILNALLEEESQSSPAKGQRTSGREDRHE